MSQRGRPAGKSSPEIDGRVRGESRGTAAASSVDAVGDALQLLSEALRDEADRHPQGHLARRAGTSIELTLSIPLGVGPAPDPDQLAELGRKTRATLRSELEALLAHRSIFRAGRVPSFRTGSADGRECAPPDSRFVFGGWSPTGVPRFFDFGQWLLQLKHPDQERLYAKPPGLVTALTLEEDLLREVIPDFRHTPTDFRVHGQVTAGWWRVPRLDGTSAPLALTFQAVSSIRGTAGQRRFGLNVLAAGPEGEPLEEVFARLETRPWSGAVSWARGALDSLGTGSGRRSSKPNALGSGSPGPEPSAESNGADPINTDPINTDPINNVLEERISGILRGLARRLEQKRRSRDRRTGHAEARHRSGDRPTRMAVEDLMRAKDDQIYVDERRGTLVVLGDRGRTHFFNAQGKLVTSVRYGPEAVGKRIRSKIWRQAAHEEATELRRRLEISRTP